jgi:non-heme chloroperoxidase
MMFLASHGYRCIAHDRRGHGRSGQPWDGNNLDVYADDLSELVEALDLKGAVMIGHSTGGGEVTRYLGRHGTGRVSKAILVSAIPPLMVKTPTNPAGLPIEVFDGLRTGVGNDRSQFYRDRPTFTTVTTIRSSPLWLRLFFHQRSSRTRPSRSILARRMG